MPSAKGVNDTKLQTGVTEAKRKIRCGKGGNSSHSISQCLESQTLKWPVVKHQTARVTASSCVSAALERASELF